MSLFLMNWLFLKNTMQAKVLKALMEFDAPAASA